MSVTILEALENAEFNLAGSMGFQVALGKDQLHNAVTLLEKGYSLEHDIDDLVSKYSPIETAPDLD